MKLLSKSVVAIFLMVGITAQGQQNLIATGGDAKSNIGSISFSVGQIAYHFYNHNTGFVSEGMQQPYELYVSTGIRNLETNFQISVYPNPTSHNLTLTIDDDQKGQLEVVLFDFMGRVVVRKQIQGTNTELDVRHLPQANYLLQVLQDNKTVKTYTIIKN